MSNTSSGMLRKNSTQILADPARQPPRSELEQRHEETNREADGAGINRVFQRYEQAEGKNVPIREDDGRVEFHKPSPSVGKKAG
nr:hypothetical protein [Mesorhizobium sp. AR10]